MTGERALRAVISIFWIAAALMVTPSVLRLGTVIVTNEDIPDLWPVFVRATFLSLLFAGPAMFLARGSQVARWFGIFSSLIGLAAALVFAGGLIEGNAPADFTNVLGVPFVLMFLFSTWALVFDRGLREALDHRRARWTAAEKARRQQLEDLMNEPSEK